MADINDFGGIQENFGHISELLDSIRAQNAMKSGDWDKALANINAKLENLSDEENTDLIKVFLAEIKRTLDERHNFVSSKFTDMESAFRALEEKAGKGLKAEEMREIFDIIATNLNVFSKEVVSQKDLLSEINLRIDDLKNDDSQKRDILRNISVLKIELEKFNNGFESIILNLNDNFKSVSQALVSLDNTENIKAFKGDIENIYLSSNAVLSALQVIDRKNRELEVVITQLVSKDDFNLEREQVAKLIAQNIQLTDYIQTLASRDGVDDLNKKVDTAVGIINALKNVLQDSSNQNQQMLIAQLERLESTVSTIISEADFAKFRNELFRVVEDGIQSSNLVRAELLDTNAELKNLFAFLNSFEIKANFQQVASVVKTSEDNVKASVYELSNKLVQETEKYKTLITTDVNGNIQNLSQKLDIVEENIKDASKLDITTILENIQSVINNIFSIKTEVHVDNMESIETIESKVSELKNDITVSKETVVKASQTNFEGIISGIKSLLGKIDETKEDLSQKSQANLENITTNLSELSQKLDLSNQSISQGIQENLEGAVSTFDNLSGKIDSAQQALESEIKANIESVSSNFGELAQKIEGAKYALNQKSQENLDTILSGVEKLSKELVETKEGITHNSETNFSNILMIVDKFSSEVSSLKEKLSQNVQTGWSEVTSNIEASAGELQAIKADLQLVSKQSAEVIKVETSGLFQNLEAVKVALENKSQNNFENILVLFDNLSKEIDSQRSNVNNNVKSELEKLSVSIQTLFKNSEEFNSSLNSVLKEELTNLENSILSLPEIIKQNQAAFEEASNTVIEQNSKNIEELSVKIQNLTKGIITKDNPFKEIVTYEFSALKDILAKLQSELSQSGFGIGEDIKNSIQKVEEQISQNKDGYEVALYNLQNKLNEYLQLLQAKAEETAYKVENSAGQIIEIKADIHSVLDQLNSLTSDSRFSDLSNDLTKKFESILLNITQFSESASLKNEESLEKVLGGLEENFAKVLTEVEAYKIASGNEISESLASVAGKINSVKEHTSLVKNDLVSVLNLKANEIVAGFAPVKESIEQIAKVDFDKMINELKIQIESVFFSIDSSIKTNLSDSNDLLSTKVAQSESAIEGKLSSLQERLIDKNSEGVNELKLTLREVLTGVESVLNTVSLTSDSTGSKDFLSEKFSNLESSLESTVSPKIETVERAIKVVLSQIDGINSSFEGLEGTIQSSQNGAISKIVEKLDDVQNEILDSQEELKASLLTGMDDNISAIRNSVDLLDAIPDNIEESMSSAKEILIDEVVSTISGLENKLLNSQEDLKTSLLGGLENNVDSIKESLEGLVSIPTQIDDVFASSKSEIINGVVSKVAESEKNISVAQEEFKNELSKGFEENINLIKENLEELISVKSDLLEEINSTKTMVKEENSNQINAIKDELSGLVEELTTAQENISSYKLDLSELLKIQEDGVKEKISAVEEIIIGEISQNIVKFKDTVKETSKAIETKIELSEENYKTSTQSLLSEVKTSFYEKVEDGLDDLKSFLEIIETKSEHASVIETLKGDILEEFSKLSETVEESISSVSVKSDLDSVTAEIETSVRDLMENLYDRILIAFDDNKLSQDVFSKSEEIERRVEDLKKIVTEDVTERVEAFGLNIEKQSEDFSNLISELKVSMAEMKENYVDLSLNSSMEISTLLTTVQEKIESIDTRLDGFNFENIIELANKNNADTQTAKEEILQEVGCVKESIANFDFSNITKGFEDINQRLDIFALEPENNIDGELSEIKELVQTQSTFIDNLKSLEQLDKLSKLDDVETVQGEIKELLSGFETKLTELASVEVDDKDNAAEIKEELTTLKSEMIESILNVFDQISFVVEAEEIKDFVEEKSEESKSELIELIEKNSQEIKSEIRGLTGLQISDFDVDSESGIKSSLGSNFEDILSSLDMLNERAQGSDGRHDDIENGIEEVKKHIQMLQSGSEEEFSGYSYSLQDIETDITKVRLILDELAKTKADHNLDRLNDLERLQDLDKLNDLAKLNEDIVSISTRTNKLLLTSDESHNVLKSNLDEFKTIVYQLEEKVRYLDNTENNKKMSQKLDEINGLVLSGVKSDKTFNQAFMYLAEWVDSADVKMASISQKLSEVDEVKESLSEIKELLPDNAETNDVLDKIVDKFDKQQKRIDKLESKIDELLAKMTVKPEQDLKSLVETVLSQAGSTSTGKVDAKLTKKVDGIDRQLTKLSKGVEKLTSYVD